MREGLKDRVGLRGEFTATFAYVRPRTNAFGTVMHALLRDVRDEAGTQVTDHVWMLHGLQMQRLKLQSGDRVRFHATVGVYFKSDPTIEDWDEREWGPRPKIKDFRLEHPSCMRREGESLGTAGLPLFNQQGAS